MLITSVVFPYFVEWKIRIYLHALQLFVISNLTIPRFFPTVKIITVNLIKSSFITRTENAVVLPQPFIHISTLIGITA